MGCCFGCDDNDEKSGSDSDSDSSSASSDEVDTELPSYDTNNPPVFDDNQESSESSDSSEEDWWSDEGADRWKEDVEYVTVLCTSTDRALLSMRQEINVECEENGQKVLQRVPLYRFCPNPECHQLTKKQTRKGRRNSMLLAKECKSGKCENQTCDYGFFCFHCLGVHAIPPLSKGCLDSYRPCKNKKVVYRMKRLKLPKKL